MSSKLQVPYRSACKESLNHEAKASMLCQELHLPDPSESKGLSYIKCGSHS